MNRRSTTRHHKNEHRSGSRRVRGMAILAGGIGSLLLGSGVFAAWTPSASLISGTNTAATVGVTAVDANGTVFTTGVSNLLPGDYLNRYVDLTNTGSVAESFVSTVTGGGILANAMFVQIDSCSGGTWISNGTCSGTTNSVLASTSTASAATANLTNVASAAVVHLRYQFKLDVNAVQATYQGTSTPFTVAISGTTVLAGNRDRTAG